MDILTAALLTALREAPHTSTESMLTPPQREAAIALLSHPDCPRAILDVLAIAATERFGAPAPRGMASVRGATPGRLPDDV